MKISQLWNPFAILTDQKLNLWSVITLVVFYVVCLCSSTMMDGLLHFVYGNHWIEILINNSIIIALAVVVFFILGILFNSKTRWIDIFHTVAISLLPMIFVVALMSIPTYKSAIVSSVENPAEIMNNTKYLIITTTLSLVILPLVVWSVVLLFNGFRTATHSRKWQPIVLFFIVLFLMNALTQIFL